jgi:predicted ATP-dependent endonuclease of OLD family
LIYKQTNKQLINFNETMINSIPLKLAEQVATVTLKNALAGEKIINSLATTEEKIKRAEEKAEQVYEKAMKAAEEKYLKSLEAAQARREKAEKVAEEKTLKLQQKTAIKLDKIADKIAKPYENQYDPAELYEMARDIILLIMKDILEEISGAEVDWNEITVNQTVEMLPTQQLLLAPSLA